MINALILVPEITKGMKSIGSKALLQIKKQTSVLDHQIQSLLNIDKNINITVCAGFEAEKIIPIIKNYNINYLYNESYKTTNQAYCIKLFLNQYDNIENLLILNNGILLKNKCIQKSMLNNESKIFILDKIKENFNLGCSNQDLIDYIFYDLPEAWSECAYFNLEIINKLRIMLSSDSINQMYLFEIINEITNRNTSIKKQYISKKLIMKINGPKDISKAKHFI